MLVYCRYKVLDLLPGHSYTFRVSAHNHMGASLPSGSLVATTLASTPEAPPCPTIFSLTPTSMRIRWVAPTWDNGMPITRYASYVYNSKTGDGYFGHKQRMLLYLASFFPCLQSLMSHLVFSLLYVVTWWLEILGVAGSLGLYTFFSLSHLPTITDSIILEFLTLKLLS